MINTFHQHHCPEALTTIYEALMCRSQHAWSVKNGNIPKWNKAIISIKTMKKGALSFQTPYLYIDADINEIKLKAALKQLMPWRKGPYKIGNLVLDSEWRGDMKWQRLIPHITPLSGKNVLDVGAGNGYFSYLMALHGANIALGIEPFLLFNYQFEAIRLLIDNPPNAFLLPLKLEHMPSMALFDTVFSMGVLYHQKEPVLHLQQLKALMQRKSELVLETLIIDEEYGEQIIPKDRYAKMRNVWCLPSLSTLKSWLKVAGFNHIRLLDVSKTTPNEQRATPWIGNNTQSLKDFLDPNDDNLTIEGLPAPKRAMLICAE